MSLLRYGFNGKEDDNEVKGAGDQIDYGNRAYDPRVGKFLSGDPIAKSYPELTPYQYASNRPIDGVDRDGNEWWNPFDLNNGPIAFDATVLYDIFTLPKRLFKSGANNVMQGTLQVARVESGQTTYQDNSIVPTFVQTTLAKKDKNEGRAKQVLGVGQMELASADVATTYTPMFMEGLLADGAANATLGILGVAEDNSAAPILIPYSAEYSAQMAKAGSVGAEGGVDLTQKFSSGASKLVSSEMLAEYSQSLTYGNPKATYVAPTEEIDALLSQGKTRERIMKDLGIEDPSFLKGDLIRIDVNQDAMKTLNLRAATGKEIGANGSHIPGGKTPGGQTEGVVNGIPKNDPGVKTQIIQPQ